jgi:hypothetical protein
VTRKGLALPHLLSLYKGSTRARTGHVGPCWSLYTLDYGLPPAGGRMNHERLPRYCKYGVTIVDDVT